MMDVWDSHGSAETTLNGGSADPMPVCIGDAQIN